MTMDDQGFKVDSRSDHGRPGRTQQRVLGLKATERLQIAELSSVVGPGAVGF